MTWSHRRRLARLSLAVNTLLLGGCAAASLPSPGAPLEPRALPGPFAHAPALRLAAHPGYTDVRVGGVTQTQAGANNRQAVEIGNNNAGSGTTRVTVGQVVQAQAGAGGDAKVRIGNR